MMRAKMQVQQVEKLGTPPTQVNLTMSAVTGKEPFGAAGESEDNTYARWTPTGGVNLTITNPELLEKFSQGQKFYVDFTEAPE